MPTVTDDFTTEYLTTWTEPDAAKRRDVIDRFWAPDGCLIASAPVDATLNGTDQIAGLIGQVYDQNIAANGLRFTYDQRIDAGDAILLRWSMLTPDGTAVDRGVEILFRGQDGMIHTDYLFMGVN
jgi:SnoaL-like protein